MTASPRVLKPGDQILGWPRSELGIRPPSLMVLDALTTMDHYDWLRELLDASGFESAKITVDVDGFTIHLQPFAPLLFTDRPIRARLGSYILSFLGRGSAVRPDDALESFAALERELG